MPKRVVWVLRETRGERRFVGQDSDYTKDVRDAALYLTKQEAKSEADPFEEPVRVTLE